MGGLELDDAALADRAGARGTVGTKHEGARHGRAAVEWATSSARANRSSPIRRESSLRYGSTQPTSVPERTTNQRGRTDTPATIVASWRLLLGAIPTTD
jgi:hypothetical protein